MRKLLIPLTLMLILAGCQRGQTFTDLPTPAQADAVATAQILTANAPPEHYRGEQHFERVDDGLNELAGYRYVVQLEFNGTFTNTPRTTSAYATAEVWFNQLASARRVSVKTTGELLGKADNVFEAAKLGPDSFLVRDKLCLTGAGDAQTAADLNAGRLVGGVVRTVPSGEPPAVINGEQVWKYALDPAALTLPSMQGGSVTMSSGELWVSPSHDVVVRFYLNLDVDGTIIFDRQLPVSGQVLIRYDLYDIGQAANISVPFGC